MKIVLDTNCLVVCLPVTSSYYCLWQAFRDKQITLCYTTDIINEYNEVLLRFYPQQFVNDVINELLLSLNVKKTTNYYKWHLISADPDDNKFVDCAFNAGADFIVTNDKHFNILRKIEFPQIQVVSIETFKSLIINQFPIPNPFRFHIPQPLLFVFFIFRIRTFEEKDFRIALKCENMRANPV